VVLPDHPQHYSFLTELADSAVDQISDCGMKYLSREAAFAKLQSLAAGARLVSCAG
jgi:methionine synthase II (cobalamin-independent)